MAYRFIFTAWFDRNLRSLRKHNPSLRSDFESFLKTFDAEAHPIIPGTSGARKARMSAKGGGKRGAIEWSIISFSKTPSGFLRFTTKFKKRIYPPKKKKSSSN